VGVSGSAAYASNVFTVQGGGSTFLGDAADAFHFAYVPLSGDGTITARMTSTNSAAQAGVMIRETLTASSNHMFMGRHTKRTERLEEQAATQTEDRERFRSG
jgi:hypothetical protein